MNIQQYKEILNDKSTERIKSRLIDTLENIKFLESIYMTGGENHFFSNTFSDAAHREREELCQLSSACYSILRARGEEL